MIRGIEAPTDMASLDLAPWLSPEEKLAEIQQSPVTYESFRNGRALELHLPYIRCMMAHFIKTDGGRSMFIESINVTDRNLYKQGIGTRLIRAGIRYGIETFPDLREVSTSGARLGVVNTLAGIVGQENIEVRLAGEDYGGSHPKPLEAMFDDVPWVEGSPYKVHGIRATLDTAGVEAFEMPLPR